ncbi:MAG TPA: chemotaxis protein CheD [Cyclobacteriaceae bacterium]
MINFNLSIGDVAMSSKKASYTCFGLGSCIGLFIQDRVEQLSAGAHIFLPEDEKGLQENDKFYNAKHAIDEILNQLKSAGSTLQTLRAKVTGGANVAGLNSQTGERNAESVLRYLIENKIYVAAVDVGGTHSRTARFESETGLLTVKTSQNNNYKTY